MRLLTPTCHAICFILVQTILTSATSEQFSRRHNISRSYPLQRNSGRTKRSLFDSMPQELRIRVKYVNGEEIDLTWLKKSQYLANQYLPVITSSGFRVPTAMDDVGDFVVYQDIDKCSAVVYFGKFKTLFGIIGMNYYVADLPYRFDETGQYPEVVGEPYVKKREFSPVHNLPQIPDMFLDQLMNPITHDSHQFLEPSFDPNPGPSSKRQRTQRNIDQRSNGIKTSERVSNTSYIRRRRHPPRPTRYHLETLVLVTKDVVEIFKKSWGNNFIEWLVRYYIIYFNAVDMMYQQFNLPIRKLLMNIAKIVMEDNETAFDVIGNNKLIDSLPQYLYVHLDEYRPDSFDHIFIFTSEQIMDNTVPVHGLTKFHANLYEARKKEAIYDAAPRTLIGFSEHYTSAVHEIAKTLKFGIDPWDEGYGDLGQCSSPMQEGSSKCDKCLKWSQTSRRNFAEFLWQDPNRCFLMNSPRSLFPPGPTGALRPHVQCQCFGFDSYLTKLSGIPKGIISSYDCHKPLRCIKNIEGQVHIVDTIRPFDSIRCAAQKVCWNGECKPPISCGN